MIKQQILNDIKALWYFDNRWILLLERTILKGGDLSIYRIKGMEILMDKAAGDQSGARYVITSIMYRQFLPYILQQSQSRSLNILDLGANVGGFPLLLALEGISLNSVISVELNPNTFTRLSLNLERNIKKYVSSGLHSVNAGVCGRERIIEVELGQGSTADNIYGQKFEPIINPRKYSVAGRTIDDICNEYWDEDTVIDICKIDIESAEFEVFEQPYHSRLKQCRFIIMEIHLRGEHSIDNLLLALKKLGFHAVTFPNNQFPEVQLFENFAFTQKN